MKAVAITRKELEAIYAAYKKAVSGTPTDSKYAMHWSFYDHAAEYEQRHGDIAETVENLNMAARLYVKAAACMRKGSNCHTIAYDNALNAMQRAEYFASCIA